MKIRLLTLVSIWTLFCLFSLVIGERYEIYAANKAVDRIDMQISLKRRSALPASRSLLTKIPRINSQEDCSSGMVITQVLGCYGISEDTEYCSYVRGVCGGCEHICEGYRYVTDYYPFEIFNCYQIGGC